MKIGIDISQIAYQGTGVETYTTHLVRELINCDTGNKYSLFGSSLRKNQILKEYVSTLSKPGNYQSRIYPVPQSLLKWLWNKQHIIGIEKFTGNLDIFHSSDWIEPPSKCRKITTIHDLIIYKYPEFMNPGIIENQKNKLHWVVKESEIVIADSESTKRDIIFYLNIPEKKIKVVYLGVDDCFQPQDKKKTDLIKNKYHISGKYFLCVGTNNPRKNLLRIIKAFNMLKNSGYRLVIAGNYGWGEKIDPKNSTIIQLNYINNFDLPMLYSGSEAFIYPSLYEGFGLPVLEAMACGTPVITSDRGSLKEISQNLSIHVNPESENSIKEGFELVINLPQDEKTALVKSGINYAKKFTWKKCARETLNIYNLL